MYIGVRAGFEHPKNVKRRFLNHCIFYKHLCDCTDLPLCRFVAFLRKKTSCMIQQCFQSCCIYPFVNTLWLYSTEPILLATTWYCMSGRTSHSHIVPNIVTNWSKCTLTGLVSSSRVLCTVFPWQCSSERDYSVAIIQSALYLRFGV